MKVYYGIFKILYTVFKEMLKKKINKEKFNNFLENFYKNEENALDTNLLTF